MSDGNFNRSLLPHTPYHSGLQAGKAMALPRCVAHDAGLADPAGQRRRTPVALPLIYDQPADLLF